MNESLRRASRSLVVTMLAGLLGGVAAPAAAADKKPVPSVVLQGGDGNLLELSLVAAEGQWLLIYLAPDSPASGRLLQAMRRWQLGAMDHVLVMVGGEQAAAREFVAADHQLPGVRFALDPRREAWQALQLSGVPTVVGVRNNLQEWRLAGVLNDPEALRTVLTSWLAGQ